jgi:hypothetical protein
MPATRVRRPVCLSGRGDAALRTASPAEVDRLLIMGSLSPWRTVESISGHVGSTNFEKEDGYGYELCHFGRDGISDFCGGGWTLSDCYRCC